MQGNTMENTRELNIGLKELFDLDSAWDDYGDEFARERGYFDDEMDDDSILEHISDMCKNGSSVEAIKYFVEDYSPDCRNEADGYGNLRPLSDPSIRDFDTDDFIYHLAGEGSLDEYAITLKDFDYLARINGITPYELLTELIESAQYNQKFSCLEELSIDTLYDNELLNEETFNDVYDKLSEKGSTWDTLIYELSAKLEELEESKPKPHKPR